MRLGTHGKYSLFLYIRLWRSGMLKIGKDCSLRGGTWIRMCANRRQGEINNICMINCMEPIMISENTIIGQNMCMGSDCVILKDIKLGNNCVIGAGIVISKDIPNDTVLYSKRELVVKKMIKKGKDK